MRDLTVLVVEDEAYIALEVQEMLRDLGYAQVTICQSYSAACNTVAQEQFDIAIFDINVGGMLSYSLISQAIGNGWAVVTMSGFITRSNPMAGRVFLSKPFDKERLRTAIFEAQAMRISAATG